ncbi:hypothetical protein GQ457_13G023630 [Hibiscus cannabinus]
MPPPTLPPTISPLLGLVLHRHLLRLATRCLMSLRGELLHSSSETPPTVLASTTTPTGDALTTTAKPTILPLFAMLVESNTEKKRKRSKRLRLRLRPTLQT